MKKLINLILLLVYIIICSNSHAQNKKSILIKKHKIQKKYVIKKQVSDSISTVKQNLPLQYGNGIKKPNEKFRIQKKLFVSPNQTESNCSGAFFSHSGLFIKSDKEEKEWTLLCEGILGFNYEKGKKYEIIVNIYDIDYGSFGCADDCPTIKYKLVKIVSQK